MKRQLFFPLLLLPVILLTSCSWQAPQQDVNNAPTEIVTSNSKQQPTEDAPLLPNEHISPHEDKSSTSDTETPSLPATPSEPDNETKPIQVSPSVTTPSEREPISEQKPTNEEQGTSVLPPSEIETIPNQQEDEKMLLFINDIPLEVQWEDNETVVELLAYVQRETITVNTSVYGGFEQVGSLPQSFSRNDVQIITKPGDIVLYSGNQLVVFFGSNNWSYTKLGHINLTTEELTEFLDHDATVIELKLQSDLSSTKG